MFKRRNPRSYGQIATELIYPRGGFRRSTTYWWHRLRRLPDQPQRIGRGIAAGVLASWTPLLGFHAAAAMVIALAIRGNLLAAFMGTFFGNPVTLPFIALASVGLGRWMMGLEGELSPNFILGEFSEATAELWQNMRSWFGPEETHWDRLGDFYHQIFLPYALGGLVLGLICAVIFHALTLPVIRSYHRRREKKMAERIARLRMKAQRDATDAEAVAAAHALELAGRPRAMPPQTPPDRP